VSLPVHNLPIRVVCLLRAERRPADQTLKHDGAQTPPITAIIVSFSTEDLRRNVIRGANSGVRELSTGFAPCVDLLTVADGKLDLVEVDGIAVVAIGTVFAASEELLVIGCFMFLVETG
jgi:hypothetical protein